MAVDDQNIGNPSFAGCVGWREALQRSLSFAGAFRTNAVCLQVHSDFVSFGGRKYVFDPTA